MNALNISSFIWGITEHVLRDHYVRGKCRDVILPMTAVRYFQVVLETSKGAMLRKSRSWDGSAITTQ